MIKSRGRAEVVTAATLGGMTNTSPLDLPAVLEQMHAAGYSLEGTLIERMGIELTQLSAERCVARMPVAGNTQPAGLLHGGASAALAETVASFAAMAHAGPGRTALGIELNATHHRTARAGWVEAIADAVHLGGTLASYTISVQSVDEDRLLCTARLTSLIRSVD